MNPGEVVKLQWLQVHRFRSVKPGTRLTFNAGPNVLLGQNGTGKSTLLELIAAAVKSDFTGFIHDTFELSYALASNAAAMTVSVRHDSPGPSGISFTADFVGGSTGGRFRLEVEGPRGSVQRLDEAGPRIPLKTLGPTLGATVTEGLMLCWAQRAGPRAKDWLAEIFSLFSEAATRRFDEALGYFEDLGAGRIEIRQAPSVTLSGHASSADSLEGRVRVLAMREWGAARYVLTDAELPFLQRAVQLLDFASAEARLELLNADRDELGPVMQLGRLTFSFLRRSGARVSERMLGHGQKRMLAFLHYAASARSVIVADELVNGLHPQWLRVCLEQVGQKQLFLTCSNPLLLDALEFQSAEDLQATFLLCQWDRLAEQMRWKRMPEEVARDLFESYVLGFQRVGGLLHTRGLW